VFPTRSFAKRLGQHSVEPAPHLFRDDGSLIELPLPGYLPLPFPFHPSYSLVLGQRYFDWGLRRAARLGLPLVLLFHLVDFAAPLPAEAVPGIKGRIFTLSHRSEKEKRSRCQAILDRTRELFDLTDTVALLERRRTQPS
jgi:hypothetical protein